MKTFVLALITFVSTPALAEVTAADVALARTVHGGTPTISNPAGLADADPTKAPAAPSAPVSVAAAPSIPPPVSAAPAPKPAALASVATTTSKPTSAGAARAARIAAKKAQTSTAPAPTPAAPASVAAATPSAPASTYADQTARADARAAIVGNGLLQKQVNVLDSRLRVVEGGQPGVVVAGREVSCGYSSLQECVADMCGRQGAILQDNRLLAQSDVLGEATRICQQSGCR